MAPPTSEFPGQATASSPVPFLTTQATFEDKLTTKRGSSRDDDAGDARAPPSKKLKQEHGYEQRQSCEMKRLKAVDVQRSIFRTEMIPERRTRSGRTLEVEREVSPRCGREDSSRSGRAKPSAKSSSRTLSAVDTSSQNPSMAVLSETGTVPETLGNVHPPQNPPVQAAAEDDENQGWADFILSGGKDPNYVHVPTQYERELAQRRLTMKDKYDAYDWLEREDLLRIIEG